MVAVRLKELMGSVIMNINSGDALSVVGELRICGSRDDAKFFLASDSNASDSSQMVALPLRQEVANSVSKVASPCVGSQWRYILPATVNGEFCWDEGRRNIRCTSVASLSIERTVTDWIMWDGAILDPTKDNW
ncbi:MAG TPA: hypothetical protein PK280_06440 [Planctomycetota bacterium]|nr:hypothetical protein [Planctomycetota bacterium]